MFKYMQLRLREYFHENKFLKLFLQPFIFILLKNMKLFFILHKEYLLPTHVLGHFTNW